MQLKGPTSHQYPEVWYPCYHQGDLMARNGFEPAQGTSNVLRAHTSLLWQLSWQPTVALVVKAHLFLNVGPCVR